MKQENATEEFGRIKDHAEELGNPLLIRFVSAVEKVILTAEHEIEEADMKKASSLIYDLMHDDVEEEIHRHNYFWHWGNKISESLESFHRALATQGLHEMHDKRLSLLGILFQMVHSYR